jgi:long-chain fatty acid transport protein
MGMERTTLFVGAGLFLLALLGVVDATSGGGFALYEGSARGNALGGGLVGRADDPSALFYNPAGITQMSGIQVMGGDTAIVPNTDVVTIHGGNATSSPTEQNVWVAPHGYATCQYSDALWFGLGVFCPFGLGTEYDSTWPGRYNIYEANLRTLTVNPNVALKATDKLSLAFGISWISLDLTLKQKIDFANLSNPDPDTFTADIDQSLSGDSQGWGINVGLHYAFNDWAAFGIACRSEVKQKVRGSVDFTKPAAVEALFLKVFNDTSASGEITLPAMVSVAVAFRPFSPCSIELGGIWTGWSSYDQLTINFGRPILDPIQPGVTSTTRKENWKDVWRTHVGLEYGISEWMDLRLSYVFDDSPVPDETVNYLVPANDRHLFNVGCGFHWDSWRLDLSYGYLHVKERTAPGRPADGVLESRFEGGHAHLVGVSLGYGF